MKICSKCEVKKSVGSFYRDKNGKNGYRSICKDCDIGKVKKWNKLNKSKHLDHQKKWRENNRQKSRDQRFKYAKTDKGISSRKEWNIKNKDHINAKSKEFRDRNPGYASYYARKRKKHIKIATLRGFDDQLKQIYLSCPKDKEIHHIIPLCDHNKIFCGLHVPWNLQILTKEEHLKAHEELRKIYG